jgi:hypothetical protein
MASTGCQLRDAVVSELNDASRSWAGRFTAIAEWLPVYEDADLATLRVAVVALTLGNTRNSRGDDRQVYGIGINLQQHVDPDDVAAVDALDELAEDVQDYYRRASINGEYPITGMAGWYVVAADRENLYSLDRMYAGDDWETWILLTIRGFR